MSTLGKTIIAGVVIAVIGVIIMVAVLGINGWKFDDKYELKTYDCTSEINTLKLDFEVGVLKTEFYDGDKIKVEYPESKTLVTTFSENNGVLSMITDVKFKLFRINSLFNKLPDTIIKIPKNNVLKLDFVLNAGTADIASGNYTDINLNMNAGTVNFENVTCDKYTIDLNAGTLKVQNLNAGYADLKMNAGDIKIAKIISPEINVKVNAGNIIIKDMESDKITAKMNAGGLNIEKALIKNINYNINAGSILTNVIGNKADYNINVEKNAGSCNVSNQTGLAADKIITLDIDAGKININFN